MRRQEERVLCLKNGNRVTKGNFSTVSVFRQVLKVHEKLSITKQRKGVRHEKVEKEDSRQQTED